MRANVFALTLEGFHWKTIAVQEKSLAEQIGRLRKNIGDPASPRGLGRVDEGEGFDLGLAYELSLGLMRAKLR